MEDQANPLSTNQSFLQSLDQKLQGISQRLTILEFQVDFINKTANLQAKGLENVTSKMEELTKTLNKLDVILPIFDKKTEDLIAQFTDFKKCYETKQAKKTEEEKAAIEKTSILSTRTAILWGASGALAVLILGAIIKTLLFGG